MRIDTKQTSGAVKPSQKFQQVVRYREKARACLAHAEAQPNDTPEKQRLFAAKYERRANQLELLAGGGKR